MDNNKSLIRSCLISAKNGLSLRQLESDFSVLVGGVIPYRENGFSTLSDYLRSMPDVVRFSGVGGSVTVHYVADASTAKIASLVQRQKTAKKKTKPLRLPRSVGRGTVKRLGTGKLRAPFANPASQRVRNVRPVASRSHPAPPTARISSGAPVRARQNTTTASAFVSSQPRSSSYASAAAPKANSASVTASSVRQASSASAVASPAHRANSAAATAGNRSVSAAVKVATETVNNDQLAKMTPEKRFEYLRSQLNLPVETANTVPVKHGRYLCNLSVGSDLWLGLRAASCLQLLSRPLTPLDSLQASMMATTTTKRCVAPDCDDDTNDQHVLEMCPEHGWPPVTIDCPLGVLQTPSAVCARGDRCQYLHLCRLHISGYCPESSDQCRLGHSLLDGNNGALLRRHCLQHLSHSNVMWMLRLRLQQVAPVTRAECWAALRLCADYNRSGGCQQARGTCSRLHLCARLVRGGVCGAGEASSLVGACGYIHRPTHADNLMCLARLHFADLFDDEILSVVRCVERFYCGDGDDGREVGSCGSSPVSSLSPLSDELGTADPVLSDSTCSPLTADSLRTRRLLESVDICSNHLAPNICPDSTCRRLHLCRYFVADLCPYGESCVGGHCMTAGVRKFLMSLFADSSSRVTSSEVTLCELVDALQCGYLTRNPISQQERKRLFQLCLNPVCRDKDPTCYRVHLCVKHVLGECSLGVQCTHSHDLHSSHNQVVLDEYHMSTTGDAQLIKLLSANSARAARKKLSSVSKSPPKVKPLSPANTNRVKSQCTNVSVGDLCPMSVSAMRCGDSSCKRRHLCLAYLMDICRRRSCPLPHLSVPLPFACYALVHAARRLMVCCPYNTRSQTCDSVACARFHLCHRYLSSSCVGECGLSHNMMLPHNRQVKQTIGLASVPDPVVVELLRARLGAPCGRVVSYSDDLCARSPFVRLLSANNNNKVDDDDTGSTVSTRGSVVAHVSTVLSSDESEIDVLSDCGDSSSDRQLSPNSGNTSPPVPHTTQVEARYDQVCSAALSVTACNDFHCQKLHPCLPNLLRVCYRQRCQWSHDIQLKLPPAYKPLIKACSKLGVCVVYNSKNGCSSGNGRQCARFHLCQKFLAGTCPNVDCTLCHSIVTEYNHLVKISIGMSSVPDAILLELLRARMGNACGCPPPVTDNNPFLDLLRS